MKVNTNQSQISLATDVKFKYYPAFSIDQESTLMFADVLETHYFEGAYKGWSVNSRYPMMTLT